MTKSTENIEKKIEAQLEKLKQLKAQKQAIEARERTKKKEQERKDDTRRKILLGSYLIAYSCINIPLIPVPTIPVTSVRAIPV